MRSFVVVGHCYFVMLLTEELLNGLDFDEMYRMMEFVAVLVK